MIVACCDRSVLFEVGKKVFDEMACFIVETITPFSVGQNVEIWVDPEWRLLNAKHHTAGHLIAALIEDHFPNLQATSAHHWINEARVEIAKVKVQKGKLRISYRV